MGDNGGIIMTALGAAVVGIIGMTWKPLTAILTEKFKRFILPTQSRREALTDVLDIEDIDFMFNKASLDMTLFINANFTSCDPSFFDILQRVNREYKERCDKHIGDIRIEFMNELMSVLETNVSRLAASNSSFKWRSEFYETLVYRSVDDYFERNEGNVILKISDYLKKNDIWDVFRRGAILDLNIIMDGIEPTMVLSVDTINVDGGYIVTFRGYGTVQDSKEVLVKMFESTINKNLDPTLTSVHTEDIYSTQMIPFNRKILYSDIGFDITELYNIFSGITANLTTFISLLSTYTDDSGELDPSNIHGFQLGSKKYKIYVSANQQDVLDISLGSRSRDYEIIVK